MQRATDISIYMENDEFIARWIAFHTRFVVDGEIAYAWNHYNTIDPAKHGFRLDPYQPTHRKQEDPAERDGLVRMSLSAPHEAWKLILGILAATDDATVFGYLETPLELLLARHGPTYIDAVVELAKLDAKFRSLVVNLRGKQWPGEWPQDMQDRLRAV
jgi:hypothetical protein